MALGLRRTRRVGFAARLKYGSSSARMMWVCAVLLGFASVRCAVWVLLTSKVLSAVLLEHAVNARMSCITVFAVSWE
jgi:hypothetical protein